MTRWFCRKRFSNSVNVFLLFRNYVPFENGGPFIWTYLNPLHPRMLYAKFAWNWPNGSWEEDENVKSLKTDGRRTTDDHKNMIRNPFSRRSNSLPRFSQVSLSMRKPRNCWMVNMQWRSKFDISWTKLWSSQILSNALKGRTRNPSKNNRPCFYWPTLLKTTVTCFRMYVTFTDI